MSQKELMAEVSLTEMEGFVTRGTGEGIPAWQDRDHRLGFHVCEHGMSQNGQDTILNGVVEKRRFIL